MVILQREELGQYNAYIGAVVSTFCQMYNVLTIPAGRYDLEDGCYVNVDDYDTRENLRYEAHRKFVDVQLMVSGEETILCAPICHGNVIVPYDSNKDVAFYDASMGPYCELLLTEGMAAVFHPWDMHAPCNYSQVRHNRKLVFKFPVEQVSNREKVRVACCGDSITFGLLSTGADKIYPAVLQSLLADVAWVGNFGRNGATVIADYELLPNRYAPFLKSPEYAQAMVSEPDIVVVMLGMNDGNPTHHFNAENGGPISDAYLQIYRNDLVKLIHSLQALPTRPKVYLVKTTAMRRVPGPQFSRDYVENFTNNMIKIRQLQQDIAQTLGIPAIETVAYMDDPAYYRDGCHLTDAGYERLAQIIHEAIKVEF